MVRRKIAKLKVISLPPVGKKMFHIVENKLAESK